jgi:hypothetical protein
MPAAGTFSHFENSRLDHLPSVDRKRTKSLTRNSMTALTYVNARSDRIAHYHFCGVATASRDDGSLIHGRFSVSNSIQIQNSRLAQSNDAMLIADYIAISVLIALALWAGAKWVLFNPKP